MRFYMTRMIWTECNRTVVLFPGLCCICVVSGPNPLAITKGQNLETRIPHFAVERP